MATKKRIILSIFTPLMVVVVLLAAGCAARERVVTTPEMEAVIDAMRQQHFESQLEQLDWMLDQIRESGEDYIECMHKCEKPCWDGCKEICGVEDWLECVIECGDNCWKRCNSLCKKK